MTRPRRLGLAALLLLVAGVLLAWIPESGRIANAFAKSNREAGRARTLELRIELRFEGDSADEVAASGTLLADPAGASRLELHSPRGFIERHLRRGGRVEASRDGRPQKESRTFLPPFHLLQVATSGDLRTALAELGVAGQEIELGYEGEHDCYVLGGRSADSRAPRPSLWVDQEDLAAVRVDTARGVRYRFGPEIEFGALRVPAWIEVRAPGEPVARLAVLGAVPGDAGPRGFEPSWLLRRAASLPRLPGKAPAGEMP